MLARALLLAGREGRQGNIALEGSVSAVSTKHYPLDLDGVPWRTSPPSRTRWTTYAAQVGTDERALHQIIKMGNVCGHVAESGRRPRAAAS